MILLKILMAILAALFGNNKPPVPEEQPNESPVTLDPAGTPIVTPKPVVLPEPADTNPLRYLHNAELRIGLNERTHTNILNSYFKKWTGWKWSVASTPWCAAFVNATLAEAGKKQTGSFLARSFLSYGKKVTTPQLGDIVVFSRGTGGSGHVAYFIKDLDSQYIEVLGGNQSDSVCIKPHLKSTILGIRRP